MTTSAIAAVLLKLPELTPNGVGLYEDFSRKYMAPETRAEMLKVEQTRLLNDVAGFDAACSWLRPLARIAIVNKKHTTYGLKHIMERADFGYVSQGIFIAAAVHLGFVYKLDVESHGLYLNISEKALAPVAAAY